MAALAEILIRAVAGALGSNEGLRHGALAEACKLVEAACR
jgi:hypothetical protein